MATAKKAAPVAAKKAVRKTSTNDVPFEGGTPVQAAAPAKPKNGKKVAFKLPKTLGACADLLYTTRQRRLEMQKEVDALEEQEKQIKAHVINTLPKSDAKGVTGKVANVKVESEEVPTVTDWEAFYKYVSKNKAFDMLQRRINPKAIEERLEAKKKVDGIGSFTLVKVSCTKA